LAVAEEVLLFLSNPFEESWSGKPIKVVDFSTYSL
jgi:hypothetical protein